MQQGWLPVCGKCGHENLGNYCTKCGAQKPRRQSPSGSTQFPWKPVLAVLAAALVLTAVTLIPRQLVGEPPDPYQDGLRTPEQVLGGIKDINPGTAGPADGRSNESTITVMDPETGDLQIIGRQGREITTHEVCAEGDYVPRAWDAAQRAAECYNRGQEDAFKLLFEYSGGKIHTGYFLAEDLEAAITRSTLPSATVRLPVAVIEKGTAHLIHYDEYDYCPQLGSNGGKGTLRLWTPPQTYSDAICRPATDAGPTDGADNVSIPEPTPTPGPTPGPSPTPIPSPMPVKQCKVFEEILGYRVHWYEMEWRACNLLLPDEYCYSGQGATIYDGRSGIARPGVLDGYIKCKSGSDTIKPPISQGDNRVCPSNREHEHTLPNGTKEIRISTPTPCPAPSTIPATSRPAESRVVKPSRGPEPNR